MIFQDPLSSLHPFYSIGKQLVEARRVHSSGRQGAARARAIEMLDRVGIPSAARRIDDYPHQLSGGMRQRVMIAMALINDPELLIADEPTTALDVTVQAQIIDLLQRPPAEFGTAIILITHDLGVVANVADEVVVMYGGRVVEHGSCVTSTTRRRCPTRRAALLRAAHGSASSDRLEPIPGQPPSLLGLPKAASSRPRCTYSELVPGGLCDTVRPDLLPRWARATRCAATWTAAADSASPLSGSASWRGGRMTATEVTEAPERPVRRRRCCGSTGSRSTSRSLRRDPQARRWARSRPLTASPRRLSRRDGRARRRERLRQVHGRPTMIKLLDPPPGPSSSTARTSPTHAQADGARCAARCR